MQKGGHVTLTNYKKNELRIAFHYISEKVYSFFFLQMVHWLVNAAIFEKCAKI